MNVFLDRQGFALYHKKITEYIDKKDSEVMGSAGKVNDVIMNGKTIVVDKIANIDNSITAEYIIGRIGIAPVGRATSDKDGNAIDETYATIDSLKQVEAIAIGRSKSIGAENLVKLQEFLNNNYGAIEFKFGDNVFIVALDEPDLWCYGTNDITENQSLTKEQMIEALGTVDGLKLKGYTFHKLETQKVDLSNYVEKEEGKGLSENDFTDELKSAYDEHISSEHASADAEKNQNAFSSIVIEGQPTVNADSPTSTLTIKAGERVSLASDSDGRTVTINASADDIKIKSIESSGATITITFMDESSIGFELDTSETDLVDPEDIIVGKAKDANLLGGRDGSHYLDYNNHANAPIVNANLSDFIEPVAGTYYRNVGLTDDTFVSGVIYYYDGETYRSADTLLETIDKKANKDEIITDYNGLSNRPIINANLIGTSNPIAGVYYRHVGSTNDTYTKGVIYYYDGAAYHPMTASIPLAEKGQPNGVAELNESGIVPSTQLPTIPTTTAQLQNNSGYVTEAKVDEKLANLVGTAPETLNTLGEISHALDEHADEYDALLQQVSSKASKEYVDSEIKEKGAFFIAKDKFAVVAGTATLSMRWNVNDVEGITEPFAGMTIRVQIPDTFAYSSNTILSIDGGINYHPVLRNKITALTNAYQEDVVVTFIYNDLSSARVYLEDGVQTTISGCWQVADYDSDRLVQQNRSTVDANFPVLCKINQSSENTTGNVYFSPDVTMNPKTGAFNATEFFEDGVSLAEKYGGNEGGMPIIRLVKVSDMNRSGVVSPTNPIRVTIQVVSGTILPTDKIELCSIKSFTYKLYDESPDATRKKGRRWRLRRISQRPAAECHPDKSFPSGMYRMICWESGDVFTPREFLRSGNYYKSHSVVTKYVRVSRMDNEGTTYHSNAVEFSFSIDNLLKPEKHTAKIHIS